MFACNQIWQRNSKPICLRNSKHICVRTDLKRICWPRNRIYFQSESNVYMVNTDNKENYGTKWRSYTKAMKLLHSSKYAVPLFSQDKF